MISKFFITRPIFACVISAFIVIAGLAGMRALPISRIPNIVPPMVTLMARLSGRERGDDRRDRRGAARAADQRRREHAVHAAPSTRATAR